MQLETIAGIVVGIIVLAPALFFTYETSEGQGVPLKLAKFVGLVLSAFPLIGLVLWRLCHGSVTGYGQRCGVMALIGVFLMVLSGGLGH